MKISVAIVEDDVNYNNTLCRVINAQEDMICCGQYFYGQEALDNLEENSPDVVIMDIQLKDMLGTDVMGKLAENMSKTNFIMCTTFEDEDKIFSALRLGATGYLVKGESLSNILQSIREVCRGGVPMSQKVAMKVIEYFREQNATSQELQKLSPEEYKVLEFLSHGLKYKEIANEKCVSVETIKKQIANVYKKLHVNNKIEAVAKFNNQNLK